MNGQGVLRVITLEESSASSEGLVSLCTTEANVAVVARCDNIHELQRAIRHEQPDLLLLDTEACQEAQAAGPEDVAGLIRALRLQTLPLTIVITPSMRFASAAFEFGAVDYLIKPVAEQRFHRAITRVRERMSEIEALRLYRGHVEGKWLGRMPATPPRAPARLHQVTIKSDGRVRFLATDDIHSIVSCRNNVIVHTANESHVFRSTLRGIEDQLAEQSFLRIERSILLNLRYIREVQRLPRRRFRFRLQNGQSHVSGALYSGRILEYLRQCQPFLDLARTRSSAKRAKVGDRRPYGTSLSHGAPTPASTARRPAR